MAERIAPMAIVLGEGVQRVLDAVAAAAV